MIDAVLHDIPDEYRDKFSGFLAEAPLDTAELRAELNSYLEVIRSVAHLIKAFDTGAMERLGVGALALLDAAGADAERSKLAQAVVRYIVEEEEDDEITGVLGLDDDTQVFNAVARAFGRDELVVELRR